MALAVEQAELRAQPRDELGGQRGVVGDEALEGVDQLHRPGGVGRAETARPVVGQHELLEALDGAQRHPPHVLHQPEPEHRRQRPELADGERCHLLERGGEGADVLCVEAALGVGDETDRQVVHPGVAGERTVGEVGQLPVVPARKVEADLGDVVPDDVEVVEQPLSGRTDVEGGRLGGDPGVRVLEDGERPVEPAQQRADAPGAAAGPEVLTTGDGASVLGEPLDAQQLAPDRAGEKVRPGAMARERAEQCSPGHSAWLGLSTRPGRAVRGRWGEARPSRGDSGGSSSISRDSVPDLVPDQVVQPVPVDPDGPRTALGVEKNALALHRRDLPERPHRHPRRFGRGALWVNAEGLNAPEPGPGVQI